jgi:ABC-type histidine transport system ATPase subunit
LSEIKELSINKEFIEIEIDNLKKECSDLTVVYNDYLIYKNKTQEIQKNNLEIADRLEFMQHYYNCVNHKTGIPSLILRNITVLLGKQCNDVLQRIADFEVEFIYDKEYKVYIKNGNIKVSAVNGSGFQKFIIDMVMRIVLTNISVLSNPNIIFIDEGFGCLDADNFVEVCQILPRLKNNFDAMIIVTHINELQAYADISLNITTSNPFSIMQHGTLSLREKHIESFEKKSTSNSVSEIKEESFVKKYFDIKNNTATCLGCGKVLKRTAYCYLQKHIQAKSLKHLHNQFIV